jgi:hypothetical protein
MENMYKEALNTADTNIYVAVWGNDDINTGSFDSPFASIEKAIAAITSSKTRVIMFPGSYTMEEHVDITVDGTAIYALVPGSVDIDGSACLLSCFKTVFGASSGTKDFTFRGINLNHDAVVGIQVDNASATAKVMLYLDDCDFEGAGVSLDIDRAGATGQAVRVYANRCYFEGGINMVVKDDGDRLRLKDCTLDSDLVTNNGAYTAEILLESCIIPVNGITGGASQQIVYFSGTTTQTGASVNVYAGAIATDVATQSYVICDHEN